MRLISLDIDGVLHSAVAGPGETRHFEWLDALVDLLSAWPDVRLSIHSTWRYNHTEEELRGFLGPLGPRFIGCAPRGPREHAVLWHVHLLGNVDDYLVLDDMPSEFAELRPPTLLLCDPARGLSDPEVQASIRSWLERGLVMADPEIMSGRPCFRGTRVPIDIVLDWLDGRGSWEEVTAAYPFLTHAHVDAARAYRAGCRPARNGDAQEQATG